MPRTARKKSESGIYHVMLRGINHQIIFEEDKDYLKYLDALRRYQEKGIYTIYAYCLMNNHIHLLIKEEKEDLGNSFKRIGSSYVYWYNFKYKRRGHLFQDRYKSEPVENDKYFMTVLRYIHQNPLKAGIVEDLLDYEWSSYREYIERPDLCDTRFALNMFSTNQDDAMRLFVEFNQEENKDECLDIDESIRINDAEASAFIIKVSGFKSPTEIQKLEKDKRNEIIKACKVHGLSLRQIERVTGVSFGVIRSL